MTSLFAANELSLLWPLLAFFVFFMWGWGKHDGTNIPCASIWPHSWFIY